jgi:hypothetical protein
MIHIRQKNSVINKGEDIIYTIVKTDNWTLPLSEHPSIVEHPEIFEIADCDIPSNFQYLNYI